MYPAGELHCPTTALVYYRGCSERKEFAPHGSKFFPLKVAPILEEILSIVFKIFPECASKNNSILGVVSQRISKRARWIYIIALDLSKTDRVAIGGVGSMLVFLLFLHYHYSFILSFPLSSSSSVLFLPFSGRQNKMSHNG